MTADLDRVAAYTVGRGYAPDTRELHPERKSIGRVEPAPYLIRGPTYMPHAN